MRGKEMHISWLKVMIWYIVNIISCEGCHPGEKDAKHTRQLSSRGA